MLVPHGALRNLSSPKRSEIEFMFAKSISNAGMTAPLANSSPFHSSAALRPRVLVARSTTKSVVRIARRRRGALQSHQAGATPPGSAVPVVDISPLRDGRTGTPEDWSRIAEELREACTEVGFFHLSGHGVDPGLLSSTLDSASEFFEQEQADKDKIWIGNSSSFRGYQRVQENVTQGRGDFHEAIDLYSESRQAVTAGAVAEGAPTNFGSNQWPQQPEEFRGVYEHYIHDMQRVGQLVMRCMAVGLGLPKTYFDEYYDDSFWVLRVIHYPPTQPHSSSSSSKSKDLGCGVHTDYGCLTMIHAEDTPGCLQAMTTKGDWVTVEPVPGAFVCNVGDMLARWTNGIYRSTPHRVLRPVGRRRISIPFFFEPNYTATIAPLSECCEETGKPPKFAPIMYGDHLLSKTSTNFSLKP